MAAIDKDYVLGIAVQLQTESIAEFEAQVKRQLEAIKPVKVKVLALTPEENQQLQKMLSDQQAIINEAEQKRKASNERTIADWKNRTVSTKAQIDEETSIINAKLAEQDSIISRSADKQSEANRQILNGWEQRTASIQDQIEAENAIIADLLARQDALMRASAFSATPLMSKFTDPNATLVSGSDGSFLEKQAKVLDKYVPKMNAAISAQKQMNDSWKSMLQSSGQIEHLLQSMGNIATWTIGAGALFAAGSTVVKGFQDAIHSQQEQVVQGFYYGAQGKSFTPQMSNQTMDAAISLARKYGDEVVKVQEAVGLWAKSTHGELYPSLAMADDALKLNAVTGMSNEEIYRSTISVLSQYHESLARTNDIYNIGVGLAQKYGGGIKMLGGEAQDAARQMIEAMDTSSAVAASFGLSMEQSAGMATALIHAGNYDSGRSAGEAISRSLAALERGKPEQAMAKMGIALHNNSKILDELVAKWNTEVPGMGNTLGNVISSSVQSSALEPLKLMINQIGLVKQATKEAYEYEKSHPLEAMYSKMQNTDAYKINQLKASFEAISITIARQFLKPMADAMDMIEKFVPQIIRLGPAIGAVAQDLLLLAAGWAAFEGFKIATSAIVGLAGQWSNLNKALGASASVSAESAAAISLSSQTAAMSLSSQQKQAIATLTNNATVTSEMEAQWKALAISQGVSIDTMIGAMAKLQADTQVGAQSVIVSEDSMATNMESVALQLGLTEDQVKLGFLGLGTAAESASTTIKAAFLSVIPVLGQVIMVGAIASQIGSWVVTKAEESKLGADKQAALAGDTSLRAEDIASTRAKLVAVDRTIEANRAYIKRYTGNVVLQAPKSTIEGLARANAGLEERKQHLLKYLYAAQHGQTDLTGSPDLSIEQQIEAAKKKALQGMKVVPPGFDESGDPTAKTPGAKADQALNAVGDAIQRNLNLLTKKDEADQKDVATAKLQIQHTTDKAKALENLRQAYNREIADRQKDIAAGQQAVSHYNNLAAHATTGAQQQEFLNKANQVQAALQTLRSQVAYLKTAEQVDVNNQLGSLLAGKYSPLIAGAKESMKGMTSGMKLKSETIPDLQALHDKLNEDLYVANRLVDSFGKLHDTKDADKFKSWAETLKSDLSTVGTNIDSIRQKASDLVETLSTEIHGDQMDLMFPGNKAIDKYAKALDAIGTKYQKYLDLMRQDPSNIALSKTVEQWRNVSLQVANANYAVDSYQEKMMALEKTPTYAAITTLGNDIGSSLTNDVMNSFTQSDQNQVYAIESQIAALQNEKNLLQGKNNEASRMMLEQRIHQLEADKNGIDQRMRHPGFLKGIEEDMAKAVMKGLTDRLTKDLQDAFVNSVLGKNPADSPQIVATQANTTALQQLTMAMQSRVGDMSSGASQYGLIGAIAGTSGAQQILASLPSGSSATSTFIPGIGNLPTAVGLGLSAVTAGQSASGASGLSALAGALGGGDVSGGLSASGGASSISAMTGSAGSSMFNFGGSGGSVPSGIGGGASGVNAATMAGGTNALLAATTIPGVMSTLSSWANPTNAAANAASGTSAPSSVGYWSNGKGNAQHIMGALGGITAAIQGYDQGGVAGAIETGMGVLGTIEAIAPHFGPWGFAIAGVAALASLFHPHYNPSTNPDMYADSGFAQGVADAQGQAYTQANGWVYEDSALKQQLGGMTELQYLNAWYNAYPGGNGLNSSGKELWDEIGKLTGNGKGIGVEGLHQGNVFVSDGHGHKVGESGNWQQVLQDIDTYTQDLYTLENQDMTGKGTWVSVNSYGAGGGGSASFSPWYSPGLSASDVNAVTAMPYPSLNSNSSVSAGVAPSTGIPSGGLTGGGGAAVGPQPMSVTTSVYLNSDVIAQQVNAFNIQRQNSGWAQNY